MRRPAIVVGLALAAGAVFAAPAAAVPDTTPPAPFTLIAPTDGRFTNDRTPELKWGTTTDDVGVVSYGLVFDGEYEGEIDAGTCSATCSLAPDEDVPEGRHTWSIVAWDDAENYRETDTWSFTIDSVAPTLTVSSPTEGQKVTAGKCLPIIHAETDSGVGLDNVIETVDGQHAILQACGLAPGAHVVKVTATDQAQNVTSVTRTITVVAPLTVTITPPNARTAVGVPVTLKVANPVGAGLSYSWDQGGTGAFGAFGASPSVIVTPTTVKNLAAAVRVRDAEGIEGTGSAVVVVGPTPPKGDVGVTIDGGAKYTNHRAVTLAVVWPPGAQKMLFTTAKKNGANVPVRATYPWTFSGNGKTATPASIRVHFDVDTPALTDSIVLDLEKPKVRTAAFRDGKLRTTVTDKVSGVATIETAARRSKPAKAKPYAKAFKAPTGARFVRVTDRAGNVSSWKQIRTR